MNDYCDFKLFSVIFASIKWVLFLSVSMNISCLGKPENVRFSRLARYFSFSDRMGVCIFMPLGISDLDVISIFY